MLNQKKKKKLNRVYRNVRSLIVILIMVLLLGILTVIALVYLPTMGNRAATSAAGSQNGAGQPAATTAEVSVTEVETSEVPNNLPATFSEYLIELNANWDVQGDVREEWIPTELRAYSYETLNAEERLCYDALKYYTTLQPEYENASDEKERFLFGLKVKTGSNMDAAAWKKLIKQTVTDDLGTAVKLKMANPELEAQSSAIAVPDAPISTLLSRAAGDWPASADWKTYIEEPFKVREKLSFPWYEEGLALYAKSLSYQYLDGASDELKEWMKTSTFSALGIYALMDIEINYEDVSPEIIKEELINYFGTEIGEESDGIYQEIKENPGAYITAYGGYLEILQLKDAAKSAWGAGYSELRFHETLLEGGAAPVDALKTYMTSMEIGE